MEEDNRRTPPTIPDSWCCNVLRIFKLLTVARPPLFICRCSQYTGSAPELSPATSTARPDNMSENEDDADAGETVPQLAKQGGARASKNRRYAVEPELEVPPVAVLVSC